MKTSFLALSIVSLSLFSSCNEDGSSVTIKNEDGSSVTIKSKYSTSEMAAKKKAAREKREREAKELAEIMTHSKY